MDGLVEGLVENRGGRRLEVVIADDHLVFRESLKIALHQGRACTVKSEASRAREVYELVEKLRPHALVLDLLLADSDGISILRELKRRRVRCPTLMLTRVHHPVFVRDALAAGALGYALKSQPLGEIEQAVRSVAEGEPYLAPELSEAPSGVDGGPLATLSVREREVFWRVLEGWASKEVARELCISPKTVEAHRFRINRKLGVRSTPQLLALAVRERLI